MMALLYLWLNISLLWALQSQAGMDLQPDATYRNNTRAVVYLVLELPPERAFENNTKYPLKIIKQHELARFCFQLNLQSKIDSLQASIQIKEGKLKSLNKMDPGVKK